jgi:hypothetical protein
MQLHCTMLFKAQGAHNSQRAMCKALGLSVDLIMVSHQVQPNTYALWDTGFDVASDVLC